MTRRRNRGARPNRPLGACTIGTFSRPPRDLPAVTEVKWRKAFLKFESVGAGDGGKIEIITAVRTQQVLLAQQRIPGALAGEKLLLLFHKVTSYALPGIGDTGTRTYPSTKIRAYPLNNLQELALSFAAMEREDQGELNEPARLCYTWPEWMQQTVVLGDATTSVAVVENYHTARGVIYLNVSFAFAEE